MEKAVLVLDRNYQPMNWISREKAVCHEVTNEVIDHLGEVIYVFRGGQNKVGVQSRIETNSIIVIDGESSIRRHREPSLTNSGLFQRDRYICAYCGGLFHGNELTRDHIVPTSKGGRDVWMNVVTACKKCNALKGDVMPGTKLPFRQLGPQGNGKMDPLYVPYVPCRAEHMLLKNKNIKADQMAFLLSQVKNKKSRMFEYAKDVFGEELLNRYSF